MIRVGEGKGGVTALLDSGVAFLDVVCSWGVCERGSSTTCMTTPSDIGDALITSTVGMMDAGALIC